MTKRPGIVRLSPQWFWRLRFNLRLLILRANRWGARKPPEKPLAITAANSPAQGMNMEHGSNGYKVVETTDLTTVAFYGFTCTEATVITTLAAPVGTPHGQATKYTGDEAALAGVSLPAGYYPIRGSAITLASGTAILWRE